ncbi:MAG: hypothetical protein ABGU93_04705 [Acetobacterium sp.]|uniref:hypothetical protein n=1 Tax=Acetobacterium sp. TaxID=1872094 RepID=UPI003242521D
MDETVKAEREKRRIRRKRKRQRSSIVTIMILFIVTSAGVVGAQTQGYEVFYHGESLGYVQSSGVFKSAVERIENDLMECYNYDNIHLGNGFELIPARVENPMDLATCVKVLNSKGIELYVSGAAVLMDGQKIGTVTSLDQAQSLIEAYQNINSNKNISELKCVEVMVPLSETKDFAAMLSALKARTK